MEPESTARIALLIQRAAAQASVGIWIGQCGTTIFVNACFERLLGVTSPAGVPSIALLVARVQESGAGVVIDEFVIPSVGGRDGHVRLVVVPLADGGPGCIVVTATDVTREVQLRNESLAVRTQLEVAIHHAPVVLWTIDKNGIVRVSEGAALGRLGVRSGELVGKSVFDIYSGHPTIARDIRRALNGDSFSYLTELEHVTFETWLAPIRDARGDIVGAIGVSTDVTERARLQVQVIRNDRVATLGVLAAGVAHEVNNPLTYAMLSLQNVSRGVARVAQHLESETPDCHRVRAEVRELASSLEIVTEGLERIGAVTSDLRTFARADDKTKLVDIRQILGSVLQLISKELTARATLTTVLEDVPLVEGSDARLGQVFLNLLINAMHALGDDRAKNQVSVVVRSDGAHVVVVVSDNGSGVPPALRQQIFEPFVTGAQGSAGTGLGLFVSMSIVKRLGGTLTVGERPGGGAEFEVRIPVAPGQAVAASRPEDASQPSRGGRVLVVDSDARVASSLATALVSVGYEVVWTDDGRRAIDLLSEGAAFGLCYCDVIMRETTGMEVFDEVKRRSPGREGNIVFMTGGAFTPAVRRFLDARPEAFVEKPFDVAMETARRFRTP